MLFTMKSEGAFPLPPEFLENRIAIRQVHSHCFVMSISHVSGCAMMCRKKTARHHRKRNQFGLWLVPSGKERETVGYKCRAAPGMAITGNGANDTPVQSQVERDKTVATNEDSR